jgi:flagellar protein FliL
VLDCGLALAPALERREADLVDRFLPPQYRRLGILLAAVAALVAALPAGAADREAGPNASIPGVPTFFNIEPIVLPVIEGNRIPRQVGVLLTLELAEGHTAAEARDKERELTDAFITELYRIYEWRAGDDRVVNERLIKERLQAAADRVLGPGVVHAILIRQLLEEQR